MLQNPRQNEKLPSSWLIEGCVEIIEATVETALAKSFGEGDLLNVLFNFSKTGEVLDGGWGNRWAGNPDTCEKKKTDMIMKIVFQNRVRQKKGNMLFYLFVLYMIQ